MISSHSEGLHQTLRLPLENRPNGKTCIWKTRPLITNKFFLPPHDIVFQAIQKSDKSKNCNRDTFCACLGQMRCAWLHPASAPVTPHKAAASTDSVYQMIHSYQNLFWEICSPDKISILFSFFFFLVFF